MTNNINPIIISSQVVGYTTKKDEKKEDAAAEKATGAPGEQKEVAASDVLSFMAAQSVDVTPTAKKTLDVSKYVTPEQAARIAGFVQGFESQVAAGLKAFDSEFPGTNLSDSAKLSLVAGIVEQNDL